MNTPSIEEQVKNMGEEIQGMYFEAGARIGVHHWRILCEKLTSALSQARQEGKEEAIKEIRDGFYKRGETGGKDTIVWDATDVVKVMDEILSALTTEGE